MKDPERDLRRKPHSPSLEHFADTIGFVSLRNYKVCRFCVLVEHPVVIISALRVAVTYSLATMGCAEVLWGALD
jgi:hypothetical protein